MSEPHHDRDHHDADEHHHHHEHAVSYADAIRLYRADKDEAFRTLPQSPIPAAERDAFQGLPYFDVNESLRFDGLALEPYTGSEPSTFEMETTTGRVRHAHRAGVFRFDVAGAEQRLTAYSFEGGPEGSVFVPVVDATSGRETYGAGRYLDLEPDDDGTYSLDFNLLYHPSCVYDPKFSCPLTPAENRLPVRIEAGERLPA
jgi:uncharacterized protein (DUF1684 family)